MATSTQRQQPLKRVPTAKISSPKRPVNQQLTNPVYKTPFFIENGHETWSIPRVFGLYFCFVFVVLIHFDCGTYLHVTRSIFLRQKSWIPRKYRCRTSPLLIPFHKSYFQAFSLTKKASIRLFLFLMKVAFRVPCWFDEWRISQNVPHVYCSRQSTFFGPRKRLSHNIIWSMGFQKILVLTSNSMYQWAFDGIDIS